MPRRLKRVTFLTMPRAESAGGPKGRPRAPQPRSKALAAESAGSPKHLGPQSRTPQPRAPQPRTRRPPRPTSTRAVTRTPTVPGPTRPLATATPILPKATMTAAIAEVQRMGLQNRTCARGMSEGTLFQPMRLCAPVAVVLKTRGRQTRETLPLCSETGARFHRRTPC